MGIAGEQFAIAPAPTGPQSGVVGNSIFRLTNGEEFPGQISKNPGNGIL